MPFTNGDGGPPSLSEPDSITEPVGVWSNVVLRNRLLELVGVVGVASAESSLPFAPPPLAERSAAADADGRRKLRMNRCLVLLPPPPEVDPADGLGGGISAAARVSTDIEDASGLRDMKCAMALASRWRIREATGEISMDCCLRFSGSARDTGACEVESCCIEREGVMFRGRAGVETADDEVGRPFNDGSGLVMKGNFERVGEEVAVCGAAERWA